MKHGMSYTRTYTIWSGIKKRCLNKNTKIYPYYGGRGIKICDQWMSFNGFHKDVGDAPEGHELDRIDNDGNYEPGNVRWANKLQQMNNTSKNKWIKFNGKTQTLAQWAKEMGIGRGTLWWRYSHGLPIEKILSVQRLKPSWKLNRKSRVLEFNGKKKTLAQWSRETGLRVGTIWQRLNMGWNIERTLTEHA